MMRAWSGSDEKSLSCQIETWQDRCNAYSVLKTPVAQRKVHDTRGLCPQLFKDLQRWLAPAYVQSLQNFEQFPEAQLYLIRLGQAGMRAKAPNAVWLVLRHTAGDLDLENYFYRAVDIATLNGELNRINAMPSAINKGTLVLKTKAFLPLNEHFEVVDSPLRIFSIEDQLTIDFSAQTITLQTQLKSASHFDDSVDCPEQVTSDMMGTYHSQSFYKGVLKQIEMAYDKSCRPPYPYLN